MFKVVEHITVRFAQGDDAEWCLLTLSVESKGFMKSKITLNEIIVAEIKGELVGILELEYLWPGHSYSVPHISGIIVLEQYRRRGIGRSMLSFLEGYLRDRGFKFLLSSSQLDELPPQEWHRHMGFEECGILAGICKGGVGEVFFRKKLL